MIRLIFNPSSRIVTTIFLLSCLLSVTKVYATTDSESQLLPGSYKISLVVFDPDERYPAELSFKLADDGRLMGGQVRYPTYNCEATVGKGHANDNSVKFTEKITVGEDICTPMAFEISVKNKAQFKPKNMGFVSVVVHDSGTQIRTVQKGYKYKPTDYASFRLKYRIKGWSDIATSADITLLNDYLKLRSKTINGKKAHNLLYTAVRNKNQQKAYFSFMQNYPISEHLSDAVEQLYFSAKKQRKLLPLMQTLGNVLQNEKAIKHTYYLVKEEKDIGLLTAFQQQFSMHSFIGSTDTNQQLAKLYRDLETVDGLMTAYELTGDERDFSNAVSLVVNIAGVDSIRHQLGTNPYTQFESEVLAKAYRSIGTFTGYLRAYILSNLKSDWKGAYAQYDIKGQLYNSFTNNEFNLSVEAIFSMAEGRGGQDAYQSIIDAYPESVQAEQSVTAIFDLIANENSRAGYLAFIDKYPRAQQVKQARAAVFGFISGSSDITDYQAIIERFPDSIEAREAITAILTITTKKDYIAGYDAFITAYPRSPEVALAISRKYSLLKKQNKLEGYNAFITQHPNAKEVSSSITAIFQLYKKQNKMVGYLKFLARYPKAAEVNRSISAIYELTKEEHNVAGYAWFIDNYSAAPEALQALSKMHQLAYEIASNIDTIEAYNDIVIAYPTAPQVKEANLRAYELEVEEYTGMLSDEEKEARRLLIASKILEQSADRLSESDKLGYILVVNRMNNLLKQEFNSTDATLRHLESNEFKDFVQRFDNAINRIDRQLSRIASNTSDLSSLLQSQSRMMNNHFKNAAQDRDMEKVMVKEHQFWERYVGKVGY